MDNFVYNNPTKIIFGKDSIKQVGEACKNEKANCVMVVYGGDYLKENGTLDLVKESLKDAGLDYVIYDGVQSNPCVSQVKKAAAIVKEKNVDFLLAIGGGSAIDTAKGIAIEAASDINIIDVLYGNKEVDSCFPVGVISTIAGSGSEASCSVILTIDEQKLKRAYDSDKIRPRFAIMDPISTFTLPKIQMLSGGCDILMHTLERYFTCTTSNTELIDRMSEGLLITVMEAIKAAKKDPCDYEARANLMWAGSLSHNGLLETGRISDWATHRLEHELSGLFDVIHGCGLTALWATWAKYVYKTNLERFFRFAVEVMKVEANYFDIEETALKGIEALNNFFKEVGMPTSIDELGLVLNEADIEQMANNCLLGSTTIGHFKPLLKEDIITIYNNAIQGGFYEGK
ncbi:iron-containing alcohol dehydrogenase [Maledivibacter halophilus]|uniref:Uncharacterized protein n=1 Tax=Maledivibacter halophilus TaxID=36842 RepID=A0A1T5M8R5_9FIRM|nr:iron-containing alcohol dehydrogenase [Maledivibacter halophilus]SKC84525.1 hypothetical protein SAMN02194393_04148 [Maledivibacter halophilus]